MEGSSRFEHTRGAHRTELAEDYVETILELIESRGEARLTDIAAHFGVAHPTVSKAMRRLEAEGLVVLNPYRSIRLTSKGEELARACQERHHTVVAFLAALGVDQATAEIDAEGIEHHASETTLRAMKRFVSEAS